MTSCGVYRHPWVRTPLRRNRRSVAPFSTKIQPLAAAVIAFTYATPTAIRITRTSPATGGNPAYTYDLYRNGSLIASNVTSPYDDSSSLSSGVVYTYFERVTDTLSNSADSSSVTAALPFNGTGGKSAGIFLSGKQTFH